MGLDFTLTDDPQPTSTVEEGLTAHVMTETSSSKAANAIADILGLSSNPYLSSKEDNNQTANGDTENALFTAGTLASSITSELSPVAMNTLSLSQPSDSEESVIPSQETSDAVKNPHITLQSLGEADSIPTPDNEQPLHLSDAVQDLLSSLPALPESNQPLALSNAAQDLLNTLPDVTFMLSSTHNTHTNTTT